MPRKGKKKKQNTQEEASPASPTLPASSTSTSSTSTSSTSAALTSTAASTSATAPNEKKQQQVSDTLQQPHQQGAWGPRQQQQAPRGPPPARGPQQQPQQQVASGQLQQQQAPQGLPQQPQQQVVWGPRQQQQAPRGPPPAQGPQQQPQQQVASGQLQQQQAPQGPLPAWGRQQQPQQVASGQLQQQQAPQGPSQQPRQQVTWGPRQQQQAQRAPPPAWGPQQQVPSGQQQAPQGPSQQPQQQVTWGPRQQQQASRGPPPAWGPQQQPQQQVASGQLQQQQILQGPPPAWGPRQQQQASRGPPPAWGPQQQPQQQVASGQLQQQQILQGPPPAWGPRQQVASGLLQQQQVLQGAQQQTAWRPQQQIPPGSLQQQKQGAQAPQKQRQRAQFDIGGAGDYQRPQTSGQDYDRRAADSDVRKEQPINIPLSELSLKDTSEKTSTKAKMTSSTMKQYQLAIPKRLDPRKGGTLGKRINVFTNMFQIIFNKDFVTNAVHYDVSITPIASKGLYRKVFEKCRESHFSERYPAFDGRKNAYSANDLPFNNSMETEIEIYDDERDKQRRFKITLNKVANIDLGWIKHLRPGIDEEDRDQTSIQVLDIIMRHTPESRYCNVGRSLFWNINNNEPLGGGLSLSRGGFQSAILGWKPYLNVDVAHKGFPTSQNVINLMEEFARKEISRVNFNTERYTREKVEKYLKGLKVNYQIPNQPRTKRTYRVNGLGPNAEQYRFEHDGSMMTIVEYFARHKNYTLKYPNIPCLWVGATNREEKIYLPAELCVIVLGQSINRKLDEEQTTNMIRKAATDAITRQKRINEAFGKIDVNNSNTMKQEFHLSVDTRMKQVDARVLDAPKLRYASGTVTVNRGTWQMQRFNQASNLERGTWTILDLSNKAVTFPAVQDFANSLRALGSEVGMTIQECQTPTTLPPDQKRITNYFETKYKQKLKLIIVIVPDRTDAIYSIVKQITEISLGILTQCVKARTVHKNNSATVKNILLKINSKLNGINHTFNTMPTCLKDNACMLVGADVTHPSPDAVNIPSIAAVAASSDTSAFQYNIALRLQQPKEEIIRDLEEIIISQLLIYREKNSRLPKRIIYYRDGVSEGQLAQVMYFEIGAIRRACSAHKASDIQVTCLVVQKRHHVRLFPLNPSESDDRKNSNVRAGTIVDTEITHPNHIDFYLVSHASIQGTARPTKYRCICNDSNYTEDQIEELTYYLCHIYARCTRAVSYPAPTYYAHLGAYRGRALIQGLNISLDHLEREQSKLEMKMAESPMCFI